MLKKVAKYTLPFFVVILFLQTSTLSFAKGFGITKWTGSWHTSLTRADIESSESRLVLANQTLRQIIHPSTNGSHVRFFISNVHGTQPIELKATTIGIQNSGAQIEAGSLRNVSFSGAYSITIYPGTRVVSDPISLTVRYGQNLVISTYLENETLAEETHESAFQTSYIIDGDGTHDLDPEPSTTRTSWYWLNTVETRTSLPQGAIVTLGDSITDGAFTTLNANNRWPDFLARRLNESRNLLLRYSVLNAGIGGNRLLYDGFLPATGESGLSRFERDVLVQLRPKFLILALGINDIQISTLEELINSSPEPFPIPIPPGLLEQLRSQPVSAESIISGMKQLIAKAHARNIAVIGSTILPYKGSLFFFPRGEDIRQAVNTWIRNSEDFDYIVDFDAALRNPSDPEAMLPEYDSGDGLHPSDAGMEKLSQAFDLEVFKWGF